MDIEWYHFVKEYLLCHAMNTYTHIWYCIIKKLLNFTFNTLLCMCICIHSTGSLAKWLEYLPMTQETGIQTQIDSYQRLKKWYLMPPCLTHSIIRYGSRVKWSNPGKGVVPFPTPWCGSYWKGSLRIANYFYGMYAWHGTVNILCFFADLLVKGLDIQDRVIYVEKLL